MKTSSDHYRRGQGLLVDWYGAGMCCAGFSERLVTISQIGKRLDMPRSEVEALVQAPGFPPPVGEVESSSPPYRRTPLWRWPAVREFACTDRAAA